MSSIRASLQVAETHIYSVSQVVLFLNQSFELHPVFSDLWVGGEISNYTRSSAGHQYFTIKDASAQLRCVLFRSSDYGISIENGLSVIVHGRMSLYETRGELQVYVDLVQLEGVGALQLEFERLKARLDNEGLFDVARKRPLPRFPRRVAVITSPTGAVWHDIKNITSRRYPIAELLLIPAQVQGENAAPSIVRALLEANALDDIDLIILARGGGSIEELWPFNEEVVARAIYGSKVPVVSAVGHETDVTIADLVADLRAPTPSAAAEIVFPNLIEIKSALYSYQQAFYGGIVERIRESRSIVEDALGYIQRLLPDLGRHRQRVDDTTRDLEIHIDKFLSTKRSLLAQGEARLKTLDPKATLERGYALVQIRNNGEVVSKTGQVKSGDSILVTVSDGSFPGIVGGSAPIKNRASVKGKESKDQLPLIMHSELDKV